MSSDTRTISLSRPLVMAEGSLSTLTLRRPVCSDMEDLSWGDLYAQLGDAYRTLVPRICTDGIAPEDMDRLAASDLLEVYATVFMWFAVPTEGMPHTGGQTEEEADRVSYTLSSPITRMDGSVVDTVVLRAPTAADLREIAFGKIYRRLVSPYRILLPRLANHLDQEDLDSLNPFDLFELMAITFLFFHSRQDTGPRAPVETQSAQ